MKVKDFTPDALDHIASEFLGKPDTLPTYRRKVHKRDGELAATDGHVLLHVQHPLIKADKESRGEVLDFGRPGGSIIAGAGWIHGALSDAVAPAMQSVWERLPNLRAAFAEKAERGMTRRNCPCCGQQFWEDEDGDFHDPETYLEENAPDEYSVGGLFMFKFADGGFNSVALCNLDKALRAARLLGGATALRYDDKGVRCFCLEGEDWFIVLAAAYRCVGDARLSIDVPAVPAGKGGAE